MALKRTFLVKKHQRKFAVNRNSQQSSTEKQSPQKFAKLNLNQLVEPTLSEPVFSAYQTTRLGLVYNKLRSLKDI